MRLIRRDGDSTMMSGMLTLSYTDSSKVYTLECGTVTAVSDDIKASVSVTPIVTYSASNAFVFDIGTVENLSFTIKRRNPDNVIDPDFDSLSQEQDMVPDSIGAVRMVPWVHTEKWSNRIWKLALESMIDRWQMKTDGQSILFTPLVQANGKDVFQKTINVNGYLKYLEIQYDVESFELLTVRLDVAVGSMNKR